MKSSTLLREDRQSAGVAIACDRKRVFVPIVDLSSYEDAHRRHPFIAGAIPAYKANFGVRTIAIAPFGSYHSKAMTGSPFSSKATADD